MSVIKMTDELIKLAEQVVNIAINRNVTISTAESCTGGLIAAAITSVAGASEIFYGGAVTYHNSAKRNLLGVDNAVLKKYGAVSPQCAIQMALGSVTAYDTLLAVSVTGIAGPGGGSKEKPVGTVWLGCCSPFGNYAYLCHFVGTREEIRCATVKEALLLLLKELER